MIEKENKEKIKYFVNGFSKVFDSKEEANHFVSLKGVSHSQVSMVVPAELTRQLRGKEEREMEEVLKGFILESHSVNQSVIEDAVNKLLDMKKGETYLELISEINQCRYHLNDQELLNSLISRITDKALSKAIQS